MNNLTSKLFGIGLLSIVLATGMSGCATHYERAEHRRLMKERGLRETTVSEDGITGRLSLFGFRHLEYETNYVSNVSGK